MPASFLKTLRNVENPHNRNRERVAARDSQTLVLLYKDGQIKNVATSPETIRWLAWKNDGSSGIAVGNRGLVLEFDGVRFEKLDSPTGENLRCASFNPANQALIVGNNGTVLYFSKRLNRVEVGTKANLRRVSWSPDGSTALLVGNNGSALAWQVGKTQEITGALNNLRSISWHPEGHWALVSGNYFGPSMVPCSTLYSYGTSATELRSLRTSEKTDIIGVQWKPDGEYALAVGYEVVWQEARLFRWANGELETLPFAEQGIFLTIIAWHPKDNLALVGTGSPHPQDQGEGAVLEYRNGKFEKLSTNPYRISCIAWNPNGDGAFIIGRKGPRTFTT